MHREMTIAIIVHGGHFRKVAGKKDDPGRLSHLGESWLDPSRRRDQGDLLCRDY